jgi:hypothetical protein
VMQHLMQMTDHIPFVPSLLTPTSNMPVNAHFPESSQSSQIPDLLLKHLHARRSPSPALRRAIQPFGLLCSPTKELEDTDGSMSSEPPTRGPSAATLRLFDSTKQPRGIPLSAGLFTPVKGPRITSDAYLLASPR